MSEVSLSRDLWYGLAAAMVLMAVLFVGIVAVTVVLEPAGGYEPMIPAPVVVEMETVAMVQPGGGRPSEVWVMGTDRVPSSWRKVDTGLSSRTYRTVTGDTMIEAVVVARDSAGAWGAGPGSARWVNGTVAAMNDRAR